MTFFGIGEKLQARTRALYALWVFLIAFAYCAQAATSLKTKPGLDRPPATPVKTKAGLNTPPADAPPRPASISLKDGKLTIAANDSDLGQILHDVGSASGMSIDGLGKSARVFGTYGPGNPRDVLSQLLAGSGYNFMMAGDSRGGAPRELLLTAENDRSAPALPANPVKAAALASPADQDVDPPEEPAPGYIAHVPPSERQTPDDDDSDQDRERVQNNLQRLEQMHSAIEQQNAPQ